MLFMDLAVRSCPKEGWTTANDQGFAMTADDASLRAGDCTSCAVKQDRSAYWHPALYFLHDNGTAEMAQEEGGMLA